MGGGPGTELLGLAKYLQLSPLSVPGTIEFTVLDSVPQWAETWQQLAEAVSASLSINRTFLPLDVVNKKSYKGFAFQFNKADIVIFNYLFSENKTLLDGASAAIEVLANAALVGSVFVVIDRLEIDGLFTKNVVKVFTNAGFPKPTVHRLGGHLDSDEQTRDMSEILRKELGSPRTRFFNPQDRSPTAFWFELVKS